MGGLNSAHRRGARRGRVGVSEMADNRAPLVFCSKSTWEPSIRREHALALLAAGHGHRVTFIERPLDIRAFRTFAGARQWLGAVGTPAERSGASEPTVLPSASITPGHMGAISERTSSLMLGRLLRTLAPEAVVVVNAPWQWPATAYTQARRVFDCADDWRSISGMRGERVLEIYERIGREADAIILANPMLTEFFPGERTSVVRNGVAEDMLVAVTPAPQKSRLVHTGTLTPRFDLELAASLLDELPDWSLDLYGQCQYPRLQDRPSTELVSLLAQYAPRLHWHGVLPRDRLAAAIDDADVALVLNRPEFSAGQDSMKLYDYAARGRPIVTTRFAEDLESNGPPHLRIADDMRSMAAAVIESVGEPPTMADERRNWAEEQRWSSRWPAWSAAAFGGS